jgi:hypothetical protein
MKDEERMETWSMLNLEAGQTATIELDLLPLPKWTNHIAQVKLGLPS